jgi:Flp pilus assembly protein TadD
MQMGEALDGLGRETDATVEFQAAAAASPKEPEVHFGLAYLFWKERRYDEAEREFRAELANDPSHPHANAYLGELLLHRDEPDAAGRKQLLGRITGWRRPIGGWAAPPRRKPSLPL